jgi:dTDP-4-amino-4,6-dideoxygalactose transaminase
MDRLEATDLDRAGASQAGRPIGVPLARPDLPDWETIAPMLKAVIESRQLTNGPNVRRLEERAAEYLGVKHCVAVASCTAGLMLILRASDLDGEVIVPGFTFSATAHAVAWNGLHPAFADCDPWTLTLDVASVEAAVGSRTSAILATHVFGTPCDVDALEALGARLGLKVFFDAAHAFGSRSNGRSVGRFGDAEVFSLTPTKPMVAGEGGIIATNDDALAERCRIGRDYGNPGDYDCRFIGLNARMSEMHAVVALCSLDGIEERIVRRNHIASGYRTGLDGVRGVSFPGVRPEDRSTFKDFTILIGDGPAARDHVAARLRDAGIETRMYYSPPVHRQTAYSGNGWGPTPTLKVTEELSGQVLTLPLWEGMTDDVVASVCKSVAEALTTLRP